LSMQELTSVPTDGRGGLRRRWLTLGAIFLVAVVVEGLVARFIKSKGVSLTGDSPSYIIQAQSYLHLTPHILSVIKSDLKAHSLSAYGPNAPLNAVAQYPGPHGIISPFEPGMGILLLPFVAAGRLYFSATVAMLCICTAGLMFVHVRVTALTGLSRRGQVLLALLFAGPALLVAVNQIYPDLPSGVFLACALVEIALIERTGTLTWVSYVVVAATMAYLPWLQIKNLSVGVVVLIAFAVVARQKHAPWRWLIAVCVVGLLAWAVLLGYNVHFFGHARGLPEASPKFTRNGVEFTLGLLFDRDQGVFVQVPFALIGLVGLWLARRKLPVAVIATVISLLAVLLLNGSYIVNPYGGFSLAGRFMWTLIPALLMWTAVVIARWEEAGRLLWLPFLAAIVGWLYQAEPIVAGKHVYYNAYSFTAPAVPAAWPGWWPGFNRVLPQFDLGGRYLGAPAYTIVVALGLACLIILATVLYMRPPQNDQARSDH
jgi:hypothetical protein